MSLHEKTGQIYHNQESFLKLLIHFYGSLLFAYHQQKLDPWLFENDHKNSLIKNYGDAPSSLSQI